MWVFDNDAAMSDLPDIYDDRPPRNERPFPWWIVITSVIVIGAAAWWWMRPRTVLISPGPVRVVKQRPGGALKPKGALLSEPEAIITLRRHLAQEAKSECIAMTSQGFRNGAYLLTAVDSCKGVRLGKWTVDAKSGAVARLKIGS